MPPGCSLQVFGVSAEGTPSSVRAGLLAESSTHAPIYVRGDKVRVVPVRKDSVRSDPAADSKQGFESNVAFETKLAAGHAADELHAPPPGSPGLVDLGTLPDADAKFERLPSNTPVLRAWGEATGVEQRWRSASEADDASGMAFTGASYVSNAATVEVGDSDAESKDGSSNPSPSTSLRDRGTWPRYSTLDDVIATALPMLSAVSSDVSDSARPILGSSVATSPSHPGGVIPETAGRQRIGRDGGGADGDAEDESKHEESASFRPRACAGAKDANDANVGEEGEGAVERIPSPSPTWDWAVRVQAAAMPRKARLRLYLEQRPSLPSPGLTLEEARDAMKEWTPEMDKSLLELLGAAGIEPVSRSRCAYIRVRHHDCAHDVLLSASRTSCSVVSKTLMSPFFRVSDVRCCADVVRTGSSRRLALSHMPAVAATNACLFCFPAEGGRGVGASHGCIESVVL